MHSFARVGAEATWARHWAPSTYAALPGGDVHVTTPAPVPFDPCEVASLREVVREVVGDPRKAPLVPTHHISRKNGKAFARVGRKGMRFAC